MRRSQCSGRYIKICTSISRVEAAVVVSYIVGVNAQRRTFHGYRALNPRGQVFTIDECSAGQVMDIESAEVNYPSNLHIYPPMCNERTHKPSIFDVVFGLCNGRRSCTIRQELLIRPNNRALCDIQADANCINVKFYCVSGRLIGIQGNPKK